MGGGRPRCPARCRRGQGSDRSATRSRATVGTIWPVVPSTRPTSVTCGTAEAGQRRQQHLEQRLGQGRGVQPDGEGGGLRARAAPRPPRRPGAGESRPAIGSSMRAATSPPATTQMPPPEAITVLAASAISAGVAPEHDEVVGVVGHGRGDGPGPVGAGRGVVGQQRGDGRRRRTTVAVDRHLQARGRAARWRPRPEPRRSSRPTRSPPRRRRCGSCTIRRRRRAAGARSRRR